MPDLINNKRVRQLSALPYQDGKILYWMDRDQRVHDNWALLHAQQLAINSNQPLGVVYVFPENSSDSVWRRYYFIIEGLKEIEKELQLKNIHFFVVFGDPIKEIHNFIEKNKIGCLVSDFSPLKTQRKWRDGLAKKLKIPFYEVDARNIVPAWEASDKLVIEINEFRKVVQKMLDEFLVDFPKIKKQKVFWSKKALKINWEKIEKLPQFDHSVRPVDWIQAGQKAATKIMKSFLKDKLPEYHKHVDPNKDVTSNLSPYLHFGMISAQRVALETKKSGHDPAVQETFLDQLIVRRELAENYCFYNKNYDNPKGFSGLMKFDKQTKKVLSYSEKDYERAKTRDELWNAAQMELLKTGKMHGLMRMYWVRKILEWSNSPEEAMKIAIYLNNKFELDGGDSNTYAGIALAIGGLNDQDRAKHSRYMNYNDKINFNVYRYIDKWIVDEPTQLIA